MGGVGIRDCAVGGSDREGDSVRTVGGVAYWAGVLLSARVSGSEIPTPVDDFPARRRARVIGKRDVFVNSGEAVIDFEISDDRRIDQRVHKPSHDALGFNADASRVHANFHERAIHSNAHFDRVDGAAAHAVISGARAIEENDPRRAARYDERRHCDVRPGFGDTEGELFGRIAEVQLIRCHNQYDAGIVGAANEGSTHRDDGYTRFK